MAFVNLFDHVALLSKFVKCRTHSLLDVLTSMGSSLASEQFIFCTKLRNEKKHVETLEVLLPDLQVLAILDI